MTAGMPYVAQYEYTSRSAPHLAGGVRALRVQRMLLVHLLAERGAVDLRGRDVDEALDTVAELGDGVGHRLRAAARPSRRRGGCR